MSEVIELEVDKAQEPADDSCAIDESELSSPTLARLIEEVRHEEAHNAHAYNRMHNRHNRSR